MCMPLLLTAIIMLRCKQLWKLLSVLVIISVAIDYMLILIVKKSQHIKTSNIRQQLHDQHWRFTSIPDDDQHWSFTSIRTDDQQWRLTSIPADDHQWRLTSKPAEGQLDINTSTNTNQYKTTDQVCVHPILKPFGSHVTKYLFKVKRAACSNSSDWIFIEDGKIILKIPTAETQKHREISCSVSFIERSGDRNVDYKSPIYFQSSHPITLTHDFFKLRCTSSDNNEIHVRFHSSIAVKPELLHRKHNTSSLGLDLNVLILGFDSISHMNFLRNFPKSYEYFTKSMDGIVLNGYNIVGDATFKALCPLLTGKPDSELPPTMHNDVNRQPMDVYPFIWNEYRDKGYVTAYAEDEPYFGTFQFRRSGFNQQPTDHYMRTYYFAESTSKHVPKDEKFCRGTKHRYHVFLDWIKDFFLAYSSKPKFVFGFHTEQSHSDNINLAGTLDIDLLPGLQSLVTGGYLNNTMLILMGDHGSRFTGLRATLQGKQEERMPFMGFVLPNWFKNKYPKAMMNLRTNVNRLSTPFDIHQTLNEILHYTGDGIGDTSHRGISLFQEIPKSRSCHQAGIAPHWCACLKWETLALSDATAVSAAEHLVHHINHITLPLRHKCHVIKLQNLTNALQLRPTQGILKFKGAFDLDKLNEDFTDKMAVDIIHYQISIITRPGGAHYESTLIYQKSLNKFTANTDQISRVNKYGESSACVIHEKGDLRKFCLCK